MYSSHMPYPEEDWTHLAKFLVAYEFYMQLLMIEGHKTSRISHLSIFLNLKSLQHSNKFIQSTINKQQLTFISIRWIERVRKGEWGGEKGNEGERECRK